LDLETVSLKKLLKDTLSYHAVEFGCSRGNHTSFLASISRQVLAVGFSEKDLEEAKKNNNRPNVEYIMADISDDWSFLTKKTNLIVCSMVLEFVENPDPVFAKAYHALEPGGLLYICEPYSFRQSDGINTTESSTGNKLSERYMHHASDFFDAGKKNHFTCEEFHEWFDDDDRSMTPRLISFLFKKPGH
jgi:trans-aconitate methyltransferase